MNNSFAGWDEVARHLMEMALPVSPSASLLNDGQRASLKAIAARIASNGIVIADEVGMGKTRIAAYVANAVARSGGRCAVLIPPGLGFQWQAEFRACGTDVPQVIRSLQGYYEAWNETEIDAKTIAPWFKQPIVMVSHRFSDWRLGQNPHPWRWWLLPEVYAAARQLTDGRLPRSYHGANDYADDARVQRVIAAAWSMTQNVPRSGSNPARRLLKELLLDVRWPEPLERQRYGRNDALRRRLENVVGLGLGVFDLIIVDEAHKSRGDDSGLTRVLDNIVLKGNESHRIALTATPIELDVAQWASTLKRIAVRPEQLETITAATEQYAAAIGRLRLGWRASAELPNHYVDASKQFESALSPYLIRRDKREDEDVLKFERVSGLPIHDYRRQEEVSVAFDDLSPAWRQAVCAAEALSVIEGPTVDGRTKRLRLTIGNGHGIASVIDETLHDANEDQRQDAFEASQSAFDPKNEAPITDRTAWWMDTLRRAFPNDRELLFEHPAILAAVKYIESQTELSEKVLVFGRFTRPLRAFVSLLNARQMLLRVGNGDAWPQRKVHGDRNGRYGDSEWPAVLAAHRQLSSPVDLDTLDEVLTERYRNDTELRAKARDTLILRIRAGLPKATESTKYDAILRVVELQSQQAIGNPDDDDRQLTVLARAITANLDSADASDADIASAFIALVNAAGDQDNAEEEQFDEDAASFAWQSLEEHLRDGYTNRQGGYARLMYGETKPQARRMIQLAFNRANSFPRVLVAQSLVGREGLNLHESCRIVVLLHPEWNPGVVEQQIGRVDRVNCRWAKELNRAIDEGKTGSDLPRIEIRPVIFKGTYDEHNWKVLQERWDDLRAQLHGEAIPARSRAGEDAEGRMILEQIAQSRPEFSPLKRGHGNPR